MSRYLVVSKPHFGPYVYGKPKVPLGFGFCECTDDLMPTLRRAEMAAGLCGAVTVFDLSVGEEVARLLFAGMLARDA
jgi:hypothetical protein